MDLLAGSFVCKGNKILLAGSLVSGIVSVHMLHVHQLS